MSKFQIAIKVFTEKEVEIVKKKPPALPWDNEKVFLNITPNT